MITQVDIANMDRKNLFASLKEIGISAKPSDSNNTLRLLLQESLGTVVRHPMQENIEVLNKLEDQVEKEEKKSSSFPSKEEVEDAIKKFSGTGLQYKITDDFYFFRSDDGLTDSGNLKQPIANIINAARRVVRK